MAEVTQAEHGWTYIGPDGEWHWSREFDNHESCEGHRPATAVEAALVADERRHRTASTAALMGEVERLRAVVNEALIKQENDRTLWDAEWQIWAGDARDALSTPSEVREPEAIGGGEAETVENRPRLLAMDHVNSIEEPIRGVDERGHPYLSYSGAHVIAAFVAGMQKQAALASPQPVSGDAVREPEAIGGGSCGTRRQRTEQVRSHQEGLSTVNDDMNQRAREVLGGPSLELCVQFSDDGQHIRKWSREPFDGGECLYVVSAQHFVRHRTEAVKPLVEALNNARERFVLALAFIGRDRGTERFDKTIDGLLKEFANADNELLAALRSVQEI